MSTRQKASSAGNQAAWRKASSVTIDIWGTFGIMQNAPGDFSAAQLAALQNGGFASVSDTRWGYAMSWRIRQACAGN